MLSNKQALAMAREIETALPDLDAMGAPSVGEDFCKAYRSVAEKIRALLPIIQLIPNVGPAIVKALKLLMAIADQACPVRDA